MGTATRTTIIPARPEKEASDGQQRPDDACGGHARRDRDMDRCGAGSVVAGMSAPERIAIFVDEDEDGEWYELLPNGPFDGDDVEYVRADLHAAALARIAELEAENERLRKVEAWPKAIAMLQGDPT